jgi:hypothetical protein
MMSVSLSIGLLEHHLVDADDIATMTDDEKQQGSYMLGDNAIYV